MLAAGLSFAVAGLGQIYNGQVRKGVLVFLTFWLVVPWLYGIVDAYRTAARVRSGHLSIRTPTQKEIAVAGAVFVRFFFIMLIGMLVAFFRWFNAVVI